MKKYSFVFNLTLKYLKCSLMLFQKENTIFWIIKVYVQILEVSIKNRHNHIEIGHAISIIRTKSFQHDTKYIKRSTPKSQVHIRYYIKQQIQTHPTKIQQKTRTTNVKPYNSPEEECHWSNNLGK